MKGKTKLFRTLLIIAEIGFITVILITLGSNLKIETPISIKLDKSEILMIVFSLVGGIADWIALAKKENPSQTTKYEISGGSPQISSGKDARNIQTTTYNENQDNSQPKDS